MLNKKGVIGSFTVTFVATVIVVVILLLYIIFASVFMDYSDASTGKVVLREDSLGIKNGVGYMENYVKLVEARTVASSGIGLSEAIGKVGYEVNKDFSEEKEYDTWVSAEPEGVWINFSNYVEQKKSDKVRLEIEVTAERRVLHVVINDYASMGFNDVRFFLDEDRDGLMISITSNKVTKYVDDGIRGASSRVKGVAEELNEIFLDYLEGNEESDCFDVEGYCVDFKNGKKYLYVDGSRQKFFFDGEFGEEIKINVISLLGSNTLSKISEDGVIEISKIIDYDEVLFGLERYHCVESDDDVGFKLELNEDEK